MFTWIEYSDYSLSLFKSDCALIPDFRLKACLDSFLSFFFTNCFGCQFLFYVNRPVLSQTPPSQTSVRQTETKPTD